MNRCLGSFSKTKILTCTKGVTVVTSILGIFVGLTIPLGGDFRAAWASQICEIEEFQAELINTAPDIEDSDVIVIGHLPDHNYVVIVPGHDNDLLEQVRIYVPDAFRSSSRLGDYIHAGAFETRSEARTLVMQLKSCRIWARVVYFRGGRPI